MNLSSRRRSPATVSRCVCCLSAWTLLLAAITSPASAEAPEAKSLYPAGLQRGTAADLNVRGKPGTQPASIWSETDGLSFELDEKGTTLKVTAADDVPPGLHWIRFYNGEGAGPLVPLLVGVLPEHREEESNNRLDEAKEPLATPVLVNGILNKSGDIDTYAIELKAGSTFVASIESHRSLATPADPVLQLLSPDGFVIEQNDDHHGFDPQIVHAVQQDGTYYVRVFAFPATPNSTINFAGSNDYVYRLTLTIGPFVDHVVPAESPEASPRAVGWNLAGVDSVTPDDLPGLHTIHRSHHEERTFVAEEAESTGRAEPLPVPCTVVGHIDAQGQVDAYPLKAAKGDALRFRVRSRSLDGAHDPVLKVVQVSDGKVLKEVDDIARGNLDVELAWRSPADGDYRLEIFDRFGHASLRHVYHLDVDRDTPGVELSVANDRLMLKDDNPLEIKATLNRAKGFRDDVSVTATGLPEGIEVTPATSSASGDTSKEVTLKLQQKEGAAAFSGPIRIVGTTAGETPLEVEAVAGDAPALGPKTQVWLTVIVKAE
ncbi:PPC domain-containing protein [Maioricimonas rarisocia]|uniref:PPC domain-containing protein n=1 Tax=Maioricimonas rarisocia TaxID=2528026 RepID=UPI0018D22ED7|nr:PPC domain-containing protein [Maioricimonas rarisocia]